MADGEREDDPIVQYIALRKDLDWPAGALTAQACHATTAVMAKSWDDEHTKAYLERMESMHKVVLEVGAEKTLRKIANKLESGGLKAHLWIEQPEGIPTALAAAPYPKSMVSSFFRGLKLLK